MTMTKTEKNIVRNYVASRYEDRNGRNVRIMSDGAVRVTVDGDGTQMRSGRDDTAGVIFAGWADDLLSEAQAIDAQAAEAKRRSLADTAVTRAARHIDAVHIGSGDWAHWDDDTRRYWVVDEDDLASLTEYLDHEDADIRRDAYSHWCASVTPREMPKGWCPAI